MPTRRHDPPVLLRQAAGYALTVFGQQEFELTQRVRSLYRPLMTEYRDQLQGYFFGNFGDNLPPPKRRADDTIDPDWTPQATWDLVRAKRLDTEMALAGLYADLVDAAEAEVAAVLDEELAEGYEQSYDLGLWSLYLGGIDSTTADPPPERGSIRTALLAAGIAGIGYPRRLTAWGDESKGRFQSRLRGLIASGATGPETLEAFDHIAQTFVGRVEGLGQNELFRAYSVGAAAARTPYEPQLEGEVWLTREDGAVCARCAAKHLTITAEQPIRDSHPGCRCRKVPIPINYSGQPIDYVAFLQKLGRR